MERRRKLDSARDYLERYPRICAHVIAESLGYAVPLVAATILKDAHNDNENWCEWIDACLQQESKNSGTERHQEQASAQGIHGIL